MGILTSMSSGLTGGVFWELATHSPTPHYTHASTAQHRSKRHIMLGFPDNTKHLAARPFAVEQLLQEFPTATYKPSNSAAVELLKAIGEITLEHDLNQGNSDFETGETVEHILVFSLELPQNLPPSKCKKLLKPATISTMFSEFFGSLQHAFFVLIRPQSLGPQNMQLWLTSFADGAESEAETDALHAPSRFLHTSWQSAAELSAALSLQGPNLDVVYANLLLQVTALQAQPEVAATATSAATAASAQSSTDATDQQEPQAAHSSALPASDQLADIRLKQEQLERLTKEHAKLQKDIKAVESKARQTKQFNQRCVLQQKKKALEQQLAQINAAIKRLTPQALPAEARH